MGEINLRDVADKWQKKWGEAKLFKASVDPKKKKYYVLEMYPYPSATYLHMGHVRNYTIGDVYARFKRMQGYNVLYPMGYDSFGLPAETAAKKEGIHPKAYAESSIKKIMEYQKALGNSYDWDRVIASHDVNYYRWNQYFFLKLLEKGLAYRKEAPVNWCETCESVLANEEAEGGKCWRCGNEVFKKNLEQWFFKITAYSDELLDDLKKISWSEKIKLMQENWIGKSYGTEVNFKINGKDWPVFTTRVDTIFGVTFMVISAQHPRLTEITTPEHKAEMEGFAKKCSKARTPEEVESLDKDGVFTGSYAVNPVNGDKIPVWAGNFVLAEYGSGMVMAVPAHDQRDYDFAVKYKIPIKNVIVSSENCSEKTNPVSDDLKEAFTEYGVLVNSGDFTGMTSNIAIEEITKLLAARKLGKTTVNYKIRDWLISRQRYWGTPIPIIYCSKCGTVPVPEKDLPVVLPEEVDFASKLNPLMSNPDFLNTSCPKCHGPAKRETDTMGGFMDSSWYFLRYCDSKNLAMPFDSANVNYWMPVDQYIGGIEHAVGHLMYARFFTKALRDMGMLKFDEPFMKLFNQGIVYKGGFKMSKSKGNVVFQTDISNKYGIDTARFFSMFVASPDKPMEWNDEGIEGSYRFINRVTRIILEKRITAAASAGQENKMNKAIKSVTENLESFRYNTALIDIMEYANYLSEQEEINKCAAEALLLLLSPFTPHVCEELWESLGNKGFISIQAWPDLDESKIDERLDAMESLLASTKQDILAVKKLIGMDSLSKIIVIVSPAWKYDLYSMIKEGLTKTRNPGELLKTIMSTDLKQYGQDITRLVPAIVKDPSKLPHILLGQETELRTLLGAKQAFESEFKASVEIVAAEASNEQKSRNASPAKPAIILS